MQLLKTLILSDGRPGHYQLAEGIVSALKRHATPQVERLDCRRGRWPGLVLAGLSSAARLDRLMLRRIYRLTPPELGQFDLIVSAGAETLAANVACARLSGAANIFYGSLRAFQPENFSLVLTSYAANADRPRHAMVMKPSPLPWFDRRPPSVGKLRAPVKAMLLLGGEAGTTHFTDEDWRQLLAFVQASHQAHGTRWIVSNSRRTPAAVSDRLPVELPSPHVVIDVRDPQAMRLAEAFEDVEAVVCTDDSSTMISEAIGMGLPTLGVTPVAHTLTLDEAAYRAYLQGSGWHRRLAIAALTPDRFLAELGQIRPLQQNPLDRLGDLIAERVPKLCTVRV
jgi:uncharacterized protein